MDEGIKQLLGILVGLLCLGGTFGVGRWSKNCISNCDVCVECEPCETVNCHEVFQEYCSEAHELCTDEVNEYCLANQELCECEISCEDLGYIKWENCPFECPECVCITEDELIEKRKEELKRPEENLEIIDCKNIYCPERFDYCRARIIWGKGASKWVTVKSGESYSKDFVTDCELIGKNFPK